MYRTEPEAPHQTLDTHCCPCPALLAVSQLPSTTFLGASLLPANLIFDPGIKLGLILV